MLPVGKLVSRSAADFCVCSWQKTAPSDDGQARLSVLSDPAYDVSRTHGTWLTNNLPTTLEYRDRRNTLDPELRSGRLFSVSIQLGQPEKRLKLSGSLFKGGRHHLARPAPGCPEIDDDRDVATADVLVEAAVRQLQ